MEGSCLHGVCILNDEGANRCFLETAQFKRLQVYEQSLNEE